MTIRSTAGQTTTGPGTGPEGTDGRMHALSCENLTKRFGDTVAVDGVSLTVAPGEAYGLLGPNGAGKSTAISMIVGLLPPDSGSVHIGQIDMGAEPLEAKKRIGYVPQEIALYPELSAQENLRFFGRLYGLSGAALRGRIDEVLDLVGLTDRAKDKVSTYSGGMKRRVNIGAALLHSPDLLILDEPTVGVDPQSRDSILSGVEDLLASGEISLIYTSHYMEEVERLCDRMAIIDRGRIIAEGTKAELVARVGGDDKVAVTLDGDIDSARRRIESLPQVNGVSRVGDDSLLLTAQDGRSLLPVLLGALAGEAAITSFDVDEPDLEATFLHLTGNSLRD